MNFRNGKATPRQSLLVLALLAALSVLYSWTANPAGTINYDGDGGSHRYNQWQKPVALDPSNGQPQQRQVQVQGGNDGFAVCGRPTNYMQDAELQHQQQKYAACPEYDTEKPLLLLESYLVFGRTMNQMRSLLRAIQYARDKQYQLIIMHDSWAADVLFEFFMVTAESDWEVQAEQALCAKIIHSSDELEGREVIRKNALELFHYRSPSTQEEYVSSMLHTILTLYQHYNTGGGQDHYGNSAKDMCSGINSVFAETERSSAIYSVIHLRQLEQFGTRFMNSVSNATGCDPRAGLDMRPDYVKSILRQSGMLKHPIVVISDGQKPMVLKRLMDDPDIGPMIRPVPTLARWIGGDTTIATMATLFIGNPASTFSTFIGQCRLALGFGHNYLYMAKDGHGWWQTVCEESCLFGDGVGNGSDDEFLFDPWLKMGDKRYARHLRGDFSGPSVHELMQRKRRKYAPKTQLTSE